LAIDPLTPSIVYAGTSRGAYKSIDGAGSWTAVNTGLPDNAVVSSLAIHPVTTTTFYAGTWGAGVFKSTNGGANWSAVNTGMPTNVVVSSLAIDPQTPSTVYAGTGTADIIDGRVGLTSHRVRALAIDPMTSTLYAGTYGGGVFILR
jgi:hypothetical protein